MNRAMIISSNKKSNDMIFDGTKKYIFLKKLPKHLKTGMKSYISENKGKKVKKWRTEALQNDSWKTNYSSNVIKDKNGKIIKLINFDTLYDTKELALAHIEKMKQYKAVCPIRIKDTVMVHEGTGMIVGEFVVGEILDEDDLDGCLFEIPDFDKHIGYDKTKKVAIEITNVIKYDEEWLNGAQVDIIVADYHKDGEKMTYIDTPYVLQLKNAPLNPIPKEEFVSWNYAQENYKYCIEMKYRKGTFEEYIEEIKNDKDFGLKSHPQAPMYVVEKDS